MSKPLHVLCIVNPWSKEGQDSHYNMCRHMQTKDGFSYYRNKQGNVVAIHEGGSAALVECVTIQGCRRWLDKNKIQRKYK